VPDDEALAQGELSVHPSGAVGAARSCVYLCDLPGQPRVPQRSRRGRAAAPFVIARLRYSQHPGPRAAPARLWGHHIAEQLRGPAVDRQLSFQLGDPLARRDQLRMAAADDPGQLAAVDQLLPTPVVDRLLADFKVVRDLRY
jgi:hypothetical protein